MPRTGILNIIQDSFNLQRRVIAIAVIDFAFTLGFGSSTPFVHHEAWGTLWCILILVADLCLVYGAKCSRNAYVVIWQVVFSLNILFLLLLLPLIPMMILAISLGDKAINNCYKNNSDNVIEISSEWIFQSGEGFHLDCDQAKDFFRGVKAIFYIVMIILVILPSYYIFAWLTVNKFRTKFCSQYELLPS